MKMFIWWNAFELRVIANILMRFAIVMKCSSGWMHRQADRLERMAGGVS